MAPDASEGREPNRYLEAIKEGYNAVGLAGAVALSAALMNPIPLLIGLVAEAAYIAFVPDSKWYEARIAARYDGAVRERREQIKREILPTLRPVLQARWISLENLREAIAQQGQSDPKFFRQIGRKLDYLLEKWLQFAGRESHFNTYLQNAAREAGLKPNSNADPVAAIQASFEKEAAQLKARAEAEQSYGTRSLLESRGQVLERRREWVGRLAKLRSDLSHQLQLIEDTFALVQDQIRARAPEMVLADLENVIWQSNTTAELLNEFGTLENTGANTSGI